MLNYDLNLPFWSDGANKTRWIVPVTDNSKRIRFDATGEWSFPEGTIFVKHFDLPVDSRNRAVVRRLETRLLVCNATGGVYGVTYKWRPDNSDAELLATNLLEDIPIQTESGTHTQSWYYPSREDCLTCHTPLAHGVLGVKARQLNRDIKDTNGRSENQLIRWKHLGLFDGDPPDDMLLNCSRLAQIDDENRPLEQRARSWLDANCAHCHRPGGTVAGFDCRYEIPIEKQNLINGPVLIDRGIDNAAVIVPNDVWRSVALQRINTVEEIKMPPRGRQVVDQQGITLIRRWIQSLPGPPVLAPPVISGKTDDQSSSVQVTIEDNDPEATLRYTLDGSSPGKTSDIYTRPLVLTNSATVRARAYRENFTRSIPVNETFIIKR